MITSSVYYISSTFPCGEEHVRIGDLPENEDVNVLWEFQRSNELVELMLLVNAIRQRDIHARIHLTMPYVPFSRQDRVHVKGEPLSIAVLANVINSLKFESVTIMDPHSDVTPALLERCVVISQHEIFGKMLRTWPNRFILIAPDGGALKKIYQLAKEVPCLDVIKCSKRRDVRTGEIDGVTVPEYYVQYAHHEAVIVDDICDGGRTFVELAKALIERGCESKRISLMVTHGFFTKGLEVFDGLIDHIYTRKGLVK